MYEFRLSHGYAICIAQKASSGVLFAANRRQNLTSTLAACGGVLLAGAPGVLDPQVSAPGAQ